MRSVGFYIVGKQVGYLFYVLKICWGGVAR